MPRESLLVVGLMSGTSADGVTAALARFAPARVEVERCLSIPYAPAVRSAILRAPELCAPELSRLNMEIGEAFAAAARRVIGRRRPVVIGSHGQTVWHEPAGKTPNTLQLGEPAVIAERTGLPVVADFRPRDIAAGGQGAPLIPAFDEFLFAAGPLRALQNVGGIANVSVAGNGRLWTGFDTGPGNCLMDLAVRLGTRGRAAMDRGGRLAARGKADGEKVAALLRDPYFRRPPPKSLERTYFAEAFLRGLGSRRGLPDTLATLNLFTAASIHDAYARFILPRHRLSEIVVSGGGALNPVLMSHLRRLFSPLPVVTCKKHGIPVMAKEAVCFAWLALRALRGETNNCPEATGARGRRVLGKLLR